LTSKSTASRSRDVEYGCSLERCRLRVERVELGERRRNMPLRREAKGPPGVLAVGAGWRPGDSRPQNDAPKRGVETSTSELWREPVSTVVRARLGREALA
jgi:hypothetical protein